MLSGPQRKFCEGIVAGLSAFDAYRAAYPKSTARSADANACRLMGKDGVKTEIDRLRAEAQKLAGSAVLTLLEKRQKLARIARGKPVDADWNNEDCQVVMTKAGPQVVFPDKLAAIKLDNDLAGEGSEAEGQDALGALLERVMR